MLVWYWFKKLYLLPIWKNYLYWEITQGILHLLAILISLICFILFQSMIGLQISMYLFPWHIWHTTLFSRSSVICWSWITFDAMQIASIFHELILLLLSPSFSPPFPMAQVFCRLDNQNIRGVVSPTSCPCDFSSYGGLLNSITACRIAYLLIKKFFSYEFKFDLISIICHCPTFDKLFFKLLYHIWKPQWYHLYTMRVLKFNIGSCLWCHDEVLF